MSILFLILGVIVGAALALVIYIFLHKRSLNGKKEEILAQAEVEAENIKKEKIFQAKEKYLQLKSEHEQHVNEKKAEIRDAENRLKQKENSLVQKTDDLNRRIRENESLKQSLHAQKENAEKKIEEYDKLINQANKQLEAIAGMSAAEAKNILMENMKAEARTQAQAYINDTMDEARLNAAKEAKRIVINTIQRTATETAIENAVTTFPIENDEIKGRIIGREGRNIRTLETMTGVDLIIDDTPEAVILSSFDPIRREVARIALEKLIVDGRIHPARIEEMVEKAQKEVDTMIREEGEAAVLEVGIHGIHPELVRLLGKMKFRTSYGQNALKHSIEVAQLTGLLAAEIGEDVRVAKRAGLLHDIGKAVDHDMEGSHIQLGAELCRKYKESPLVINAVESHHGDVEPESLIACLVQAADTISAARPGASRETLETYSNRLQQLEDITNGYKGVEKSFAIQAGREIRILVVPEQISDADMVLLARDISKQIESELEYPGQIKVNVIRESRVVDYAK